MDLQAFTITGVVTIIGGIVTAIIVQELYKLEKTEYLPPRKRFICGHPLS